MGTPDSREYDRLVGRNFRPYSKGHRRMYEEAIKRIAKPSIIFEAGFGIGWGLDKMVEANVIKEYIGCEPNLDSFNYTDGRHGSRPNVHLSNVGFPDIIHLAEPEDVKTFEHVFCIEVIEHVPMDEHLAFLKELRALSGGGTLWFSTPDIRKAPKEGVRTKDEWVGLLKLAGFKRINVDTKSWTYLYECQ
jgi:hypothetical protein